MNDIILQVEDVQKYYGNKGGLTKALDHISFTVNKSEFLGIMGPSGSGKTTLLNCISTIDTVTSGHIFVEGQDITELRGGKLADFRGRKLGFIFQDFNLLDTLTADENISLALSIAGVKPTEIRQRVQRIAETLNISDVLEKYPYQMSGGQQQRVAAARAMVPNPAIVLAGRTDGRFGFQFFARAVDPADRIECAPFCDDPDGDPRCVLRQLLPPHSFYQGRDDLSRAGARHRQSEGVFRQDIGSGVGAGR